MKKSLNKQQTCTHKQEGANAKKNRCESLSEQQTCMTLKQKGALSKRLIIKKGQRHYFLMKKIRKIITCQVDYNSMASRITISMYDNLLM